jgi:hypothetical protein
MSIAPKTVKSHRATPAPSLSIAAMVLASSGLVWAQSSQPTVCNLDADGFCIAENSRPLVVSPPTSPSGLSRASQKKLNVEFQNGLLRIDAQNVTFLEILKAVSARTGAEVQFPVGALREPVFVTIGPGKAHDVLNQLLRGSPFNYLILSSDSQRPDQITRVILSKANSGPESVVPEAPALQASEPAVTQLYGAGFAEDPDTAPVETAPIQQPTTTPNPIASQAAMWLHPDGSKLSGEELDRLQKMQIQQEQQQFALEMQQQLEQQPQPSQNTPPQ